MAEDEVVRRCAQLVEAEVDGELVALHVERGPCYGFNGTATRIWNLLDEPRRVSELRDALLEEFDVDPATCEAQVRELLKELADDGLIEIRANAQP